ncbi:amidohydrolase family protein [Methanopyrus sp.]
MLLKGKVLIGGRVREREVLAEDGWIVRIGRRLNEDADVTLKLRGGELCIPAPIDLHVHCRDPHPDYPFDFKTETGRFLLGGVATVVDMPNTRPAPTELEAYYEKEKLAREKAEIEVIVAGGVRDPENVKELLEAGVYVLGEVFLARSTDAPAVPWSTLPEIFEELSPDGPLAMFHPELDELVVEGPARNLHEHLRNRPPEAETAAVGLLTGFRARYPARIHLSHVTLPESVKIAKGVGITVDVTPHHLFFDVLRVDPEDPVFKVNPPLRGRHHRLGLLRAVRRGDVDVLASDHAPHTVEDEFEDAPSGVTGGEIVLPAALTLHRRFGLSLRDAVAMVTRRPAELLGRDDLGEIAVGKRARITVVRMREFVVRAEEFGEEDRKFPYDGMRMFGEPVKLIDGTKVYDLEESRREGEPVVLEGE